MLMTSLALAALTAAPAAPGAPNDNAEIAWHSGSFLSAIQKAGTDLGRDALEHEAEHTGLDQRARLLDQGVRLRRGPTLHLVAAHHADRLRRESQVTHNGDPISRQRFNYR